MKTHIKLTQERVDEILAWIAKNQPAKKEHMRRELKINTPESILVEVEKFTKRIYENDDNTLALLEENFYGQF